MAHSDSDCVLGCILGGAIGDAFGALYEGRSGSINIGNESPWSITDDTALTLATCEAIIEKGAVDPSAIASHFVKWFREGRIRGIGASIYKALADLCAGAHWALAGCKGEHAAGNGAAMRIAPLAFLLNPNDSDDRRTIRDVCRITHHNDEAYVGALAIVIAIQTACERGYHNLLKPIIAMIPDCLFRDRIEQLAKFPPNTPLFDVSRQTGCSGWVVESVPLALAAAERFQTIGFQEMMRQIVSCGGDTYTIASMAGQITGASVGQAKLPADWIARLSEREAITKIGSKFAKTVVLRCGDNNNG